MKSKKTLMILGVIIAVLVLGIGYATISNINLTINGKANAVVSDSDFVVQFDTTHTVGLSTEETVTYNSESKAVVAGSYTNTTTATMTVYLDSDHKSASATYKIDNKSEELSATLESTVTGVTGTYADYFTVTKTWVDSSGAEVTFTEGETKLAKGESIYLKVTVTLNKLATVDITDQAFSVSIEATPAEA